ncbi:hypothetical protein [Luteimonas saliphila]|uniref:hypothetical protein n=1 Tax=Luteimonas saliphila TaxID=2804919 RepID=UPI00192E1CFA|nr:hypothetical protein [Luteimonas saliphila]
MPRRSIVALRSALAFALVLAAIPTLNLAGGWLSGVAGLPAGGTLRLAADLLWVCVAGVTGAWLMVKTAAVAKTAHAWALFAIYLGAGLYGALAMWDDFPRWLTIGAVALLPPQVWLGWWLAWGRGNAARPA